MDKREIKFRAWDGEQMHGDDLFVSFYGSIVQHFKGRDIEMAGWELMQFTGLKDKNGAEIWEGDVLEIPTDNGPKNVVCKWMADGGFSLVGRETWERYALRFTYHGTGPVVVGNIYENPELLASPAQE